MNFSGVDAYIPIAKDKRGQKYVGSGSAALYYSASAEKYDYLFLPNQLEFTCQKCKEMDVEIIVAFDGVDKSIESLLEKWIGLLEGGVDPPKKDIRGFKQIAALK